MQSFLNLKLAQKETKIWPLVTFRIVFGVLMLFAVLRFWSKGWIHELYIAPDFHFKYFGFEWVTPFTGNGMYWVFALMGLAALCIALGFFYRISAALFFLSFTYVELLDVANYLNHYYFVSLVAFLLIFFPAHRQVSLDVKLGMGATAQKSKLVGSKSFAHSDQLGLHICRISKTAPRLAFRGDAPQNLAAHPFGFVPHRAAFRL